MIEIGRLAVKFAGRDAGKRCVIVDIIDKNYVLIDGETRRRKCNICHLEPLKEAVGIKKGASHNSVKEILSKAGIKVLETNPKPKTKRPLMIRGKKKKTKVEKNEKKKKVKKEKVNKKDKKTVNSKEPETKKAVKEVKKDK